MPGFNSLILPVIISKTEKNENPHAIPKEIELVNTIIIIVKNTDVPITGCVKFTFSN